MRECAECGTEFDWPSHGVGRVPMTCSPACRLKRKTRQSGQSRQRAAGRECPPDKHGTNTGYSYYQCGCVKCSKWAREYRQRRRMVEKGLQQ